MRPGNSHLPHLVDDQGGGQQRWVQNCGERKLTARVSFLSPWFVISVKDDTTGQSFSTKHACGPLVASCPRTSAEVIAGMPSSLDDSGLADYGRVTFTKSSIHTSHGKTGTFTSKHWTNARITERAKTVSGFDTRATSSRLSAGGARFTDTWVSEE